MSNNQPEYFTVVDRRRRGYFTVDNVLLDVYGQQLGPHGIAVYTALARFANSDQECWPTYRAITQRTGVSRRQIIREIQKMEDLNIISVTRRLDEKGQRTSHLYTLLEIASGSAVQTPGGATQALGGGATQAPGGATQAPKQSLLNNDIRWRKIKRGSVSTTAAETATAADKYAGIFIG
jgi:hypothetical protein